MPTRLPADLRRLIALQHGVIARRQALAAGLATDAVEALLESGRWSRLQRGVYATFGGEPWREAVLWAALLRAGPGAVLSHETAAEVTGLADSPSRPIHVTVPGGRQAGRAQCIPGVVVHRSIRARQTRRPSVLPPQTRIEDTVLDLTQAVRAFDEAAAWLSRATERGLATPEQIRAALGARRKVRWRAAITDVLRDMSAPAPSAKPSAETSPGTARAPPCGHRRAGTAARTSPHGHPAAQHGRAGIATRALSSGLAQAGVPWFATVAGVRVRHDPDPVTARFLRVIEGRVGGGEEFGQFAAAAVQDGEAHGDGDADAGGVGRLIDRDAQGGDVGPEPLGNGARALLAGLREQDDELLASETSGQVVGAQQR